jgi:hypothetical protein
MLDLGRRGRTAICAVFFGSEALLIATAGLRSDRAYGFRMYPESSTIVLQVSRRLQSGETVPILDNRWQATDCDGKLHAFNWRKFARYPAPSRLDEKFSVGYGVDNGVERSRDLVRWVADHTPLDCETQAFVVHLEATRNGRSVEPVDFEVAHAR